MIKTAIQKAIDRQDLSREEAFSAMETIMAGEATSSQIGAFLIAMRMKGERPHEIAGFADSMRRNATRVTSGKRLIWWALAGMEKTPSIFPLLRRWWSPGRGFRWPNTETVRFPANAAAPTFCSN